MNTAMPFPDSESRLAESEISGAPARQRRTGRQPTPATLKIIVVGTPKTGNTWVKHLLAEAYGLTPVRLKPEFDPTEARAAGPRWISHQHFLPSHELLTWGAANDVVFVSVVRHPGDVLVSLWHHMRNHREHDMQAFGDSVQAAELLRNSAEVGDDKTREFVAQGFHLYLNLSIAWLGIPGVRAVRYEDLWACPVDALRVLTGTILPVADERLRYAICACELKIMQALLDPKKRLFRQGGTGGWRTVLPVEIRNTLSSLDPYPAQFAALGYTMDESDSSNAPRPKGAQVVGPFGVDNTFEDGTPASPILMRAYFDLPTAQRDRWLNPRSIAGDSFFTWLNRSATADLEGRRTPVISELAHYIHSVRPDVRQTFPDPFGADRSAFYDWFLFSARQEYGLAHCFVAQNPFCAADKFSDGTRSTRVLVRAYLDLPASMQQRWSDPTVAGAGSFLEWLNSPAAADPTGGALAPAVTELGAYIYSIRSDVRALLPDLYGQHRVDFTKWFLSSGVQEYELDRAFTLPVVRSWAESADRVPPHVCQLIREPSEE